MNVGHKVQGWQEKAWTPCVLTATIKHSGASNRKPGPAFGSHCAMYLLGVISEVHISRQKDVPPSSRGRTVPQDYQDTTQVRQRKESHKGANT